MVHPSWCDPQLCTAKPTPPFEQYATIPAEQRKAMDFGRHMSALVDEPGAAKLQVTQQVAAWRTSTYVNVSEWYEGAGAAHVTVTELALALAVSGLLPEIEETVARYAQPPGGTEFDRHAALVAFAAQVMVATDTRRDEEPAVTVAAIAATVDRLGVVLGWTR